LGAVVTSAARRLAVTVLCTGDARCARRLPPVIIGILLPPPLGRFVVVVVRDSGTPSRVGTGDRRSAASLLLRHGARRPVVLLVRLAWGRPRPPALGGPRRARRWLLATRRLAGRLLVVARLRARGTSRDRGCGADRRRGGRCGRRLGPYRHGLGMRWRRRGGGSRRRVGRGGGGGRGAHGWRPPAARVGRPRT